MDSTEDLEQRVSDLERRLDHERLYPLEWVNRRVRDRFGNVVQSGPFAGLAYPDWSMTGVDLFSPKVLGIYEQELHPAVEDAISARPPVVVNVGAAEGYFAVGFARRLPESRVVAFEISADRARHARELAELNGVTVDVRANPCSQADLRELLTDGALVFCDCDGCEDELLDPIAVPQLAGARLVIEAHDLLRTGITETLVAAFAGTHTIERVPTTQRFVDDVTTLGDLPLVTRQLAISEFRGGPMEWLVLVPR